MMRLGALNRQAGMGDGALVRRNCKTKAEMVRLKRGRTPEDVPAPNNSDRPENEVERRRIQSPNSTKAMPTNIHKVVSRPKKRTSDNICRDGASSPEDCRASRTKSRTSQARKLDNARSTTKTPPQGWVPSPHPSPSPSPSPSQESQRHIDEDEIVIPSSTASTSSLLSQISTSTEHGPRASLESLTESQSSQMSSSTQTLTQGRPLSICSSTDPIDLPSTTMQHESRFAPPVPLTKDTLQRVAMAGRRSKRPSSRSTWSTVSSRNGSECRFSVATSRTALSEFDDTTADSITVASDVSGFSFGLGRSHRHSAPQGYFRSMDYAGPTRQPLVITTRGEYDSLLSPDNPDWVASSRSESCTPYDRARFATEDIRRSRSQGPDMGIRRVGSDKTGYRSRLHGRLPHRNTGMKRSASDRSGSFSSARPPPSPSVSVNEDLGENTTLQAKRLSLPDASPIKRSASDRTDYNRTATRPRIDTSTKRSSSERSRVNPLTRDGQGHASVPTLATENDFSLADENVDASTRGRNFRHSLPATLPSGETRVFATISERSADKLRRDVHARTSPGNSYFPSIRRDIIPIQFDQQPSGMSVEPQFYMTPGGRLAAASPGLDSIAESASSDQSGEPKLRRKAGSRQLRDTPQSAISSGMSSGSTLSLSSTNPPPSVDQPSSLEDMDENFLSAGESADCDFFSMADTNGPPRLKPNDAFLPLVGLAAKELLRQYHGWIVRESKGAKPTRSAAKREGGVKKTTSRAATKRRASNADSPVSDEEGDGVATKNSKKAKTALVPRRLACPFWKKDPDNHFQCYRKTLSRIKYVKQHLYKCHQAPIHCYRCGAVFEDELTLSDHNRHVACENQLFSHEGLSRAQVDQISRRADPALSEQDQWFALWDIIFPGQPRPQSAYIDNELSEDLCNFREFLEVEGAHNLQHYMSTLDPNYHRDEATIARERFVFARVLDALYTEWLGRRRDRLRTRIHTHSQSQSSSDSPADTPTIPNLPVPEPLDPQVPDHDQLVADPHALDAQFFASSPPHQQPTDTGFADSETGPTLVHDNPHVHENADPFVGYSSPESDYHIVHRGSLDESPHGNGYYS